MHAKWTHNRDHRVSWQDVNDGHPRECEGDHRDTKTQEAIVRLQRSLELPARVLYTLTEFDHSSARGR